MATLIRCFVFLLFAVAAPATAQPNSETGAALPPPGELAFAIPAQFHGRWLNAETGCTANPQSAVTLVSAEGLQRGDHWSEPVELIALSEDGRQLEMQVDLYFQAPPRLHRSVWQLSAEGNSLVVTDSRVNVAGSEENMTSGEPAHRVELIRC